MRYSKKGTGLEAITFQELVDHGKANGGNIVNGMPWSFMYKGVHVSHENDECYIVGAHHFTPTQLLVTYADGSVMPHDAETFLEHYEPANVLGVAVSPAPTFPAVLDACCGGRAMWFDKRDKRGMFVDVRNETIVRDDMVRKNGTPWRGWTINVNPDKVADFTALPFPDNTFALVVFDPPHTEFGSGSYMAKQYGTLRGKDWRTMLRDGFSECFRVLRPEGVLIFKWAETEVTLREILALTDENPLFGHKSGKQMGTHWVTFMKTPKVGADKTADDAQECAQAKLDAMVLREKS